MSEQHRLSDIDKEALTGTCKVCGPTKVYQHAKRQYFMCKTKRVIDGRKTDAKRRGMIVSEAQAQEAFERQGGKCGICKRPFTDSPRRDHDHKTGAFRALLCNGCNLGLGAFEDNVESLLEAVRYLQTHQT